MSITKAAAADSRHRAAPAGRSLRTFLFQLIAPPLLLLTAAGALVVFGQWSRERDAAHAALAKSANELLLAVDLALNADRSALDALAQSPLIDREDWAGLYTQAARIAASTPGALIAPTTPEGQLVFNTAMAMGAPLPNLLDIEREDRHVMWQGESLPVSSRGLTRIAREQRRAAYSDLYFGVSIKRPTLAVAVPVVRGNAVPYALIYSFPPDAIEALLRSRVDAPDRSAMVVDRSGRVIAAHGGGLAQAGRSVPDTLRPLIGRSSAAQIDELTDPQGQLQVVAAVTSQVSGWTTVVCAPADAAYAPVRRVLTAWLFAAAIVLLAAWALAVRLSLRLAAPLLRLSRLAKARPLDNERPPWTGSSIREVEQLAQALRDGQHADQLHHEELLKRRVAEEREVQAHAAADALRARELQLQLALRAGRMGFWRADLAGGLVHGDALFLQLWDLPADTGAIDGTTLLQQVHEGDRSVVRKQIEQQLRKPDGHYEGEFRLVAADGSIRWIAAAAEVVHADDGRAQALIGVITDVTERRQLEQQLRDNSAALEDAGRRKDHFLAMLGHELRNPLSPIGMGAELLRRRADEPEQVRSTAQLITRQVRHMVRLIDDLLDIARITQGKILLQPVTVELHGILRDALETARPLINARRHRLTVSTNDELLHVHGDPTRLVQIVSNLLTNAAKYTREEGAIDLHLSRRGSDALIEVRDSGIGLPPHMLESVFEAFTQSPESASQAQGGLGMGLAVVKRLAQMHGGTVSASSEGIGKGACFRVTLPLIEAPAAVADGSAAESAQTGSLRVLLVDDNRDAADSLAQLLALNGYDTRVAYDGRTALDIAQSFAPQIGILDIGLPDMDGRTLAAKLRAAADGKAMLLIAVTGFGRLSEASPPPPEAAASSAFDHLLVKPVDVEQLMGLLRTAPTTAQTTAQTR